MFRTAAIQTTKLPLWKLSAQCYSTEVKTGLSERLGAGRGKVVSADADPFASFLSKKDNQNKNERNPRNNNRRNGMMPARNNQRKRQAPAEEKFADAEGTVKGQKAVEQKSTEPRKDTRTPNKQQDRRNNNRKPRVRHEAVRAHRAVSFIDKDIDWASLDVIPVQQVSMVEGQQVEIKEDDYSSYLSAGTDIKWSDIVKGDVLSTLVGSNASLDLQQKTALLTAVANATSTQKVAVNK